MTHGSTAKHTRRQAAPVAQKKGGYHHGNLRQALLDGGLHLLRTSGIGGLTLRECARLAGVSQAAIRNHYPDKQALLAGLAARGFQALARRRGDRPRPDLPLNDWLSWIIENYVDFAVECPDLFRLMFAFKGLARRDHPELDAVAHESYDALSAALRDILAAEKLGTVDVDTAAFMLWSSMHGVAMLLIDDQFGPGVGVQVGPQERCRQLAQSLAAGWRSKPRAVRPAKPVISD